MIHSRKRHFVSGGKAGRDGVIPFVQVDPNIFPMLEG